MSTIPSKADEITAVLRTEILRGQYRPGERLPSERELSTRFESNRGAIREVIKKLEQLGIVVVNPGGVRVQPVEEATLDVLGHLLGLDEVARPELLGQTMDVMGAMMSLSTRSAVEHSDEESRAALLPVIDAMISSIGDPDAHQEQWQVFSEALMSIHGNLVLKLVGNGLRTQFLSTRVESEEPQIEIDHDELRTAFHSLKAAIEKADPDGASNAIRQYFNIIKSHIINMNTTDSSRRTNHG